jgi:hypothetical protein
LTKAFGGGPMRIYRKHMFAYVPAVFRILVIVSIIFCIFRFDITARILKLAQLHDQPIYAWGNAASALVFFILLAIEIYRILVIRSTYIKIDADSVYYHSGIFPWNTHTYYWRPFQIFSSSFMQSGFFNWLFSHGSVIITGKEGVTSNFEAPSMWRPKQCSTDINHLVTG